MEYSTQAQATCTSCGATGGVVGAWAAVRWTMRSRELTLGGDEGIRLLTRQLALHAHGPGRWGVGVQGTDNAVVVHGVWGGCGHSEGGPGVGRGGWPVSR